MKFVPFNINNNFRVKLTPVGLEQHRGAHDALRAQATRMGANVGAWDYTPPRVDADGWTRMQAWDVMRTWGERMGNGFPVPFETTIEVEIYDDARVERQHAPLDKTAFLVAAEEANQEYGQWMPQSWLDIFQRIYDGGRPPSACASNGRGPRPARNPGYMLVPIEPTEKMLLAGGHVNSEWLNDAAPLNEGRYVLPMAGVWKAMVHAGPDVSTTGEVPAVACPNCKGLSDAHNADLAEIGLLREALQRLYDETADYITINHLGPVHHNRSMQMARDALAAGVPGGVVPVVARPDDLRERAERMRQHILTKVVSRLCDVPSGKFHGEWGCGLCGGVGKGPATGVRDFSTIAHEPDCMCVPLPDVGAPVVHQPDAHWQPALNYLLKVYTDLHQEALADSKPFVEVATGNMPHFLTALRNAANIAGSAPKMEIHPDALRYRKFRAAHIAFYDAVEEGSGEVPDWETELSLANTAAEFDAVFDAMPPVVPSEVKRP